LTFRQKNVKRKNVGIRSERRGQVVTGNRVILVVSRMFQARKPVREPLKARVGVKVQISRERKTTSVRGGIGPGKVVADDRKGVVKNPRQRRNRLSRMQVGSRIEQIFYCNRLAF
jgi:hypothetical protein